MAISNNSTGLRPGVCTSTTRPSAPYTGQKIYETDTKNELTWDGSAWSRPWNQPWGQVGYVKKTSVTSIVTSPPVTVFSVTFTAVSGRMYKVTTELYLQSASTNTYINCAIYNGSTRIQGADYYMSPTVNLWHSPTLFTYFSGASGSTTISVQCAMGAGTGQVYADTGGYANALMVEDVGPA